MLGPPKLRRLDEPIAVSLEHLVPADHVYRHLEARLDLSFVRAWSRALFAARGRPSIDPVVSFKLQLEGIRSERKRSETAALNLAHRWYLCYALNEELPNHASLTRIRQRLGLDVFQRYCARIVYVCQGERLVWGREWDFDATKVEANAGIVSLVPRSYDDAKTHLAGLFTSEGAEEDEKPATVADLPDGIERLPAELDAESVATGDGPPWRLLEERRLDPNRSPVAATGVPETSASAPAIRMPHPGGIGVRFVSATTTTTSSTAASGTSSWLRSSRRPRSIWALSRATVTVASAQPPSYTAPHW